VCLKLNVNPTKSHNVVQNIFDIIQVNLRDNLNKSLRKEPMQGSSDSWFCQGLSLKLQRMVQEMEERRRDNGALVLLKGKEETCVLPLGLSISQSL
jgi:hypothetical protein